jgi:hypothetical protein
MMRVNTVSQEDAPIAPTIDWQQPQSEMVAEAHRLYDAYVKPLERDHWGEYAVVAPDGRVVVNPDEREAVREAVATLSRGHLLVKIGRVALGTLPRPARESWN